MISKPLDDTQKYLTDDNQTVEYAFAPTTDLEKRKEIFIDKIEKSVKNSGVVINGAKLFTMPLEEEVVFYLNGYTFGWNNKGATKEQRINTFINYLIYN